MKTLRMTNNCSKWVDRRKPQNRVVKYIIDKTVDVCLERERKAAKNSAINQGGSALTGHNVNLPREYLNGASYLK